jgi:methionyl-tRNA synthetase
MAKRKFYITTAIDYVNSDPHLGHAYEKIIADIIARWKKINGFDVFFLTGTDENASKVAKAAKEEGAKNLRDIQRFVDKKAERFKELCKVLNIDYSFFIRTTDKKHKKRAKEFFKLLYERGYLYKGKYKGFYCINCEAFYNQQKCPIHQIELKELEEENYFFKLSLFKDRLIKIISNYVFPEKYAKEILKRLETEELKDLSVSREKLRWGIKVPFDKKQTIYVWIDALSNYITALDWPNGRKFKKYWPADIHVIGKDINWFHSVIWPSLLMALNIELPKKLFVHGFINLEGEKLSKARGIVVDPFELVKKYGSDILRYYLISSTAIGDDMDFDENKIVQANNELADKLGNLVSRVIGLAKEKEIKKCRVKNKTKNFVEEKVKEICKDFNNYEFSLGIKKIIELLDFFNKYIQENKLWELEGANLQQHLYFLCEGIRLTTLLLYPIMPNIANTIAKLYGFEIKNIKDCKFGKKKEYLLKEKEILFKKI